MKKSILLHLDSLQVLEELSNEQAGVLFKAIKDFANGKEPNLDFSMKLAFLPFKNQFIRDNEKYEKTCELRREAGAKGGKQKVANASKCEQELANLADNKNKNKNDNKNINKKNNIFLEKEKKINFDRLPDIGETIQQVGYRQEAEEKNQPPISARPPLKKEDNFGTSSKIVLEEKNKNDFEAVFLADNGLSNTNTPQEVKEAKNKQINSIKSNVYNDPSSFDGLWQIYQVGNYESSKRIFQNTLSLLEKEKLFKKVKEYVEKTPLKYRKSLETYLKNKHYNDLIIDRREIKNANIVQKPVINTIKPNPELEEIRRWHREKEERLAMERMEMEKK